MTKKFEGDAALLVELGAKQRWEQFKADYKEALAALKAAGDATPPWNEDDLRAQFAVVCERAAHESMAEPGAEGAAWNEAQRDFLCEKGRLQRMIDDVLASATKEASPEKNKPDGEGNILSFDDDGGDEAELARVGFIPMDFLAHGMGRLKVDFGDKVATVLLDGDPWFETGVTKALEIATYEVTLRYKDSYAPRSQSVTIHINQLSTVTFSS